MRVLLSAFAFVLFALPLPLHSQTLSDDDVTYIQANTIFTIYHELGHALIDIMRLPVLAREEDAADVLGVVLSEAINDPVDTETILVAAADNFAFMAYLSDEQGIELPFWDMHSLDMQRYYGILCLYYGADPEAREDLARELELPEERAQTCPEEYALAEESWGPILDEISVGTKGNWIRFSVKDKPTNAAEKVMLETVEAEAAFLNDALSPDFRVNLVFAACGEPNAFFDLDSDTIIMCRELSELFVE